MAKACRSEHEESELTGMEKRSMFSRDLRGVVMLARWLVS